jgi:hypothetical protein
MTFLHPKLLKNYKNLDSSIVNQSNEFDLFHDSEKLILTDFHVSFSVGSLYHVGDGVIVQIKETFADHGLDFSEIQVACTVIVKMLKHFSDLLLDVFCVEL